MNNNNDINFFQTLMSSALLNEFKKGALSAGPQAAPQGQKGKMPSLGDFAKMSKEALGGFGGIDLAQFEENAKASEAFLKNLWDMLMGFNDEEGGEPQGGQIAPKPALLKGLDPILNHNLGQNQNNLGGQAGALGGGFGPVDAQGKEQFGTWKQGQEGNCASVATIKAAQQKFGNNIFKNVQQTGNGGVSVTLQDGKQISLTREELDTAKRMSNFQGQGADLESAQLCYAVMAKNAQMNGHEGARSFAQACHSLNNGEDPFLSAKFLGIENRIKAVNPNAVGNNVAVVWSQKHAIYTSGGKADRWGQTVAYNGTDAIGGRAVSAFVLV